MARNARLVSAPPARGQGAQVSWRQLNGSMGAITADGNAPLAEGPDQDAFEDARPNEEWEREVREREAAMGIEPERVAFAPAASASGAASILPGRMTYSEAVPTTLPITDIADLPMGFSIKVEQKEGGWFMITAPDHHVGLHILSQNLFTALQQAPGALALLLRMDGAKPAKGKRKPA